MPLVSVRPQNTIKFVFFYLTTLNVIRQYECLHCYSCIGKDECGILFSPNSSIIKRAKSDEDDFFDVCTISVNPDGVTTRGLIDSSQCRSSMTQFCCKEDWCNSLPAPPLPALTNRTCILDRCSPKSNKCDGIFKIATLSSATESCFRASEKTDEKISMSYKKQCLFGSPAMTSNDSSAIRNYFCCNSPECNQQPINGIGAIHCYTCDSRITGLTGCSILNVSSPYVYQSTSSDPSEACATIIGLKGQAPFTNAIYAPFAIRTFVQDCRNQPLGVVSYGGATFLGRINCCWRNYCNVENLDVYMTRPNITENTASKQAGKNFRKILVIRITIFLGSVLIICAIFLIYQYRRPIFNIRYRTLSAAEDIPL